MPIYSSSLPCTPKVAAARLQAVSNYGHLDSPLSLEAPVKQQLGAYQLVERIGVGGMAEVFLAHARRKGDFVQPCVVKVLHTELADNRDFTRMLLEEAGLIAQLRHNNIASLYDVGREDGKVFIVMEYVAGEDLHAILAKSVRSERELPIPFAIHVATQLCAGLHFAHTRHGENGEPLNLIHRDISPPNVLVSPLGEIKLIDFGVAKFSSELREKTRAGVIKGKFGYMSPEQAWDEELDQRSDLFSVGVCLYEMLTGRSLYGQSDDAITMLKRAREADIDPVAKWRPDVPDELAEIVHKSLETNRSNRFQSAHEMERSLRLLLSEVAPDYTSLDAGALVDEFFDIADPALANRSPRIKSISASSTDTVVEKTEPMKDIPDDVRKSGSFATTKAPEDVSDEATVNLVVSEADFSQEKTELFDEERISGAYPVIDRDADVAARGRRGGSTSRKKKSRKKGRSPSRQTREIEENLDEQETDPQHGTPEFRRLEDEETDPHHAADDPTILRHVPDSSDSSGEAFMLDDDPSAPTTDMRQRLMPDDEPAVEPRPSTPKSTSRNPTIDPDSHLERAPSKMRPSQSKRSADDKSKGGIDPRIQIAAGAIFVLVSLIILISRFI